MLWFWPWWMQALQRSKAFPSSLLPPVKSPQKSRRSGSPQCPPRAAEREVVPGPLRITLGTLPPADLPDRAGFRGVRGRSQRGRGLCSPGCRPNQRRNIRTQPAHTQATARSSASRTRHHLRARGLPVLWFRSSVQAGQRYHRDARGHPPPVEGGPDRQGEVLLPGLREDHSATGIVPCHAARTVRSRFPCDAAVREVLSAPTA